MGRRRGPEHQRAREEFGRGPGPRQIVEELRRENIIGDTQLDTRTGQEAVVERAVRTGAFSRRWIGPGDEVDLPAGIRVYVARLKGAGEGQEIDAALLPQVPPAKSPRLERIEGKVGRGQIEDGLNGADLIKDGTLPLDAFSSRPWPSPDEWAGMNRRVKALKRENNVQGRRIAELERRAHKHN